jgi:hypothetical protein
MFMVSLNNLSFPVLSPVVASGVEASHLTDVHALFAGLVAAREAEVRSVTKGTVLLFCMVIRGQCFGLLFTAEHAEQACADVYSITGDGSASPQLACKIRERFTREMHDQGVEISPFRS